MASHVAIISRHWARCNNEGSSSSGLIQCRPSEENSLDGVKCGSYTTCLISDKGLQRCLDKCAWLCIQKAGKEREILRNGREGGCSGERNKGEGKKEQKIQGLKCWKCFQENIGSCSSVIRFVELTFVSTSSSDRSSLLLQSSPGLTALQGSTARAGSFTDECSLHSDLPQSILASALAP